MLNPFLIAYFVFLFGFLLSAAAIVYHLIKFQLNRKTTVLTTILFLAGTIILVLINVVIAAGINWKPYSIIF